MPIAGDLYYTESGRLTPENLTLLLIHGAGSSLLTFPAALRRLMGYHVLALDLPGHGRSAGYAVQSVTGYARRVFAFMDVKGIYRAVLAGCSMGGAIALEAALQAPDRVQGLGVIAAGARFRLDAALVDDLSSIESKNAALERLKDSLFGPGASRALVALSMRLLREGRPGVVSGDWQACAAFDIHNRLREITHPVWIAAGEDDRLVPPAAARYLAAHLPNARMQLFSGAGHMLVLEKPDEIHRGLLDFLDSLIKQPD